MAKTQISIRVIRFEGVSTMTSCLVFQDSEQLESLLPIISEKRIKVNDKSIYRILAFSGSSHFSVSFSSNLLDEDGMFWLPLFQNQDDFIQFQMEEVDEPRVLILVHKKTVEDGKSQLITEESANDYEFMPEIKLDYSESGSNVRDSISIVSAKDRIEEFNEIGAAEKNLAVGFRYSEGYRQESFDRERIHKYSSIGNIENLELFQDTPLITLKSVENHEDLAHNSEINHSQMLEMSINYQSSLNTHKRFAESILQEMEEKSSQLTKALTEISLLKLDIQKLEIENNYLKGMNNGFIGAQIDDLVNEIGTCKKKIWELERRSDFKENLDDSERKLELIIKAECEKFNSGVVVKEDEEVFSIYGRKYNILIKNGKLVCRLGSIYKDFRQVLLEHKSESRPVVQNQTKSPFRKNLCEINSSSETPRSMSKSIDPTFGKPKKQIVLKRVPNNNKKLI